MTQYSGVRSLDAEIILDFVKGDVTMDYSRDKPGNLHDGNTLVTTDREWQSLPRFEKIKYVLWMVCLLLDSLLVLPAYIVLFAMLVELKIITNPKIQFEHHKFIKWFYSNLCGIYEQSRVGDLKDTTLEFIIPHNLWIEYELEGEYRDKIESISLLRNFIHWRVCGRFLQNARDGWKMIFKFNSVPKVGSCTIKYTYFSNFRA